MNYFLEDVARFLFDANHGDFRNTIVVFPGRRARLFFNKFISGFTDKPLWAPQYFSISDFITQLSGLQQADQLTLCFRLFKVFKEVTGSQETFDSFYYYCEMILSDFDEIDKNFVDAALLYKNLSDIKALDSHYDYLTDEQIQAISQFWDIFISARNSDEKDQFIEFWQALKSVYFKFNELLDAEGIAYEGKAYRKAVELIDKGNIPLPDNQLIVFVGFNALNKSEEKIFDYYKKSGNALFFWDYDPSYINSEIHEAGLFLRQYIKRFPSPVGFFSKTYLTNPTTEISSFSVPSNISQAKIIYKCLEECITDLTEDPGQTAIILGDENLLLPVISSLPSETGNVNISMGYPIVDTPVFNFINLLSEMQARMKLSSKSDSILVYHDDFFKIMNHQFLIDVANNKDFQDFKKNALEKNTVYIDPVTVKTESEVYKRIFIKPANAKVFGTYLTEILLQVVAKFIDKKDITKEEKWQLEVIYSIYKVLMRFDALLLDQDIEISLVTVLKLLKKILKGISVPFEGEPLTGIQIIGILETRTLDFKNIILLSMNEGKFPGTSHKSSFIPYNLREGFGLQTLKHQDAIYAYYFYRLLHRAEKVILVHNTKSEGLQKGEPSRYILQLKYDSEFVVNETDLGYLVTPINSYSISADKSTDIVKKLYSYLRPEGKNILSPSALNTYLNCRLRFYYRYVKELKETENVDEDIENNVFGSILHKAVKIIYQDYEGKVINASFIDSLLTNKNTLQRCIDRAFAEEFFHKPEIEEGDMKGRNLLIRKVIEKYIIGILIFDKQTAPFQIVAVENKFLHELSFSANHGKIALGGYIDRLDQKDGFIRVIDYKTGKVKDRFSDIDELFDALPAKRNEAAFQTFIYALILEKELGYQKLLPSLFFVRNIHKPDFGHKIKMGNEIIEDYKQISARFQERLNSLLEDFFNPEISYTQTDDLLHCINCPYNVICRRRI